MDRTYCRAPGEEGRATFETLTELLVEFVREHA
jgi:hypothetical protein